MQPQSGTVLVEPTAQLGPLAYQRLVCDLGGARIQRDQPRLREPVEQRFDN